MTKANFLSIFNDRNIPGRGFTCKNQIIVLWDAPCSSFNIHLFRYTVDTFKQQSAFAYVRRSNKWITFSFIIRC